MFWRNVLPPYSQYESNMTQCRLSIDVSKNLFLHFQARKMGCRRGQLICDGTCAETRFRLSAKRTSPFKSAGASVQSTTIPFASFPFTSPPVRHRVPSHFNWPLQFDRQVPKFRMNVMPPLCRIVVLTVQAAGASEPINQSTRHYIPEDRNLSTLSVNLEKPILVAVFYCGGQDQLPIWSSNFAQFLQEKY